LVLALVSILPCQCQTDEEPVTELSFLTSLVELEESPVTTRRFLTAGPELPSSTSAPPAPAAVETTPEENPITAPPVVVTDPPVEVTVPPVVVTDPPVEVTVPPVVITVQPVAETTVVAETESDTLSTVTEVVPTTVAPETAVPITEVTTSALQDTTMAEDDAITTGRPEETITVSSNDNTMISEVPKTISSTIRGTVQIPDGEILVDQVNQRTNDGVTETGQSFSSIVTQTNEDQTSTSIEQTTTSMPQDFESTTKVPDSQHSNTTDFIDTESTLSYVNVTKNVSGSDNTINEENVTSQETSTSVSSLNGTLLEGIEATHAASTFEV